MSVFNQTAADALLKELYTDQKIGELIYTQNPLFARLAKKTDFAGASFPQPVVTSPGAGGAGTFADAYTNQYAPVPTQFLVTRASEFAISQINGETLESTATDAGAFADALEFAGDMAFQQVSNNIARGLFSDTVGNMGVISGFPGSGVITALATPADAVNFEPGMTLEASATAGGAARAGLGYIISIDRDTGAMVVATSAALAAAGTGGDPSAWADGDYLRIDGSLNVGISGLASWLPVSAPGATTFFGVDRTTDSKLGGVRFDGSALSISEALIKGAAKLGRAGGTPDEVYMNHDDYANLINALGSKVQFVDHKVGEIGFEGIKVHGAGSTMTVFADRNCPAGRAYMLSMKDWKLRSLGVAPHFDKMGGNVLEKVLSADSVQLRVKFYGNLVCSAPGHSAVIVLPS